MDYMQRHGRRRARPQEVIPGTLRVIAARMDYLPPQARDAEEVLADAERAYVSRYALGRDYHKVLRSRLAQLADKIRAHSASQSHRVFVDTGPVSGEKGIRADAGLGWIGKHTNLLHSKSRLVVFSSARSSPTCRCRGRAGDESLRHVPRVHRCCPTAAIVAPYELDATRCISYLTIELRTAIPEEFRKALGNRIYGCDDCQLVCPWNKFARFARRATSRRATSWTMRSWCELFAWSERSFCRARKAARFGGSV
jgi:epoxyqueuosine reductase